MILVILCFVILVLSLQFDCITLGLLPIRATLGPNPVDNRGAWQPICVCDECNSATYNPVAAVFYTFILAENGGYNVNTCGQLQPTTADSYVVVYAVDAGIYTDSIPTACFTAISDNCVPLSSSNGGCDSSFESSLTFPAVAGMTYIIAVAEGPTATPAGFTGTFTIAKVN